MSSSADLPQRELEEADLHRFGVRLARVVIDRGGAIVSGHDWRPHGVMKALLEFARRYAREADDQPSSRPPVRNFVPWPAQPSLDDRQRAGLAHVLSVEALGLPGWCRSTIDRMDESDPMRDKLARLFAVAELRRRLAEETSVRVCLGGKMSGFSGRYPGIIEEVALALAKRQPVYLVGWAGGATGELISMLRTGKVDALARSLKDQDVALKAAFGLVKGKIKQQAQRDMPDWMPGPARPWEWSMRDLLTFVYSRRDLFSREGNGLDRKENEALWSATTCDASVDWIMRGLKRALKFGS